jgi:Mrp family chromosome partitioning ATPase
VSHIKHKIVIVSNKGGVGKSTFSTLLAFSLSRFKGKRKIGESEKEKEEEEEVSEGGEEEKEKEESVGLMDVDICGPSIPHMTATNGHSVHSTNMGWQPVYLSQNLSIMSIAYLIPSQNDAVIWRGPKKTGLIKQFLLEVDWPPLDYLVIDCPPGTSDEHISLFQFMQQAQIDGAVIITTPQVQNLLSIYFIRK